MIFGTVETEVCAADMRAISGHFHFKVSFEGEKKAPGKGNWGRVSMKVTESSPAKYLVTPEIPYYFAERLYKDLINEPNNCLGGIEDNCFEWLSDKINNKQ